MPVSYRGIVLPDGADWADISIAFRSFLDTALPVGLVSMFSGNTAPAGYLLCDGSAIPAGTDYNALRTLIGANTPDFRGRAPFGPGASGVVAGTPGGAQTVTLTDQQMPYHGHAGRTNPAGNHYHSLPSAVAIGSGNNPWGYGLLAQTSQRDYNTDWVVQGDHAHDFGTDGRGGGQAHDNMPPYRPINFIVKY